MRRSVVYIVTLMCLNLLLAAAASPALAADDSGKEAWIVEYYFEIPNYLMGVNSATAAADSAPARYKQLVLDWAAPYQPAEVAQPQAHAWVSYPPEGTGRWNHLVHTAALHVELGYCNSAMLDELDARLASPGAGLAPLSPGRRWRYADYDRTLHPESYAAREVLVDGQSLHYPEELAPELAERVQSYVRTCQGGVTKLVIFDLAAAAEDFAVPYGPLAKATLAPDGRLEIATIPTGWDFVPPGTPPTSSHIMYYHDNDDDSSVARQVRQVLEKPSSADLAQPAVHQGVVLVYPLLPPQRWETGHDDDFYALEESIAAQTDPLYAQYEAALTQWYAGHPEFSDKDYLNGYAAISPHGWWMEATAPAFGREGGKYRTVAKLRFELQVYSPDPAVVDELRALLDNVAGVHPRVERSFSLIDYGRGQVSFSS